jgi:cobalt-precorrin-5B (C1)-methyltransferase
LETETIRPALSSRLVNGRLLRCGYTTGSCAAAAAGAAAWMLLTQLKRNVYSLITPKGTALTLDILDASYTSDAAVCAVKKDAGDDPDVTNGILVYARVWRIPSGIRIDGGEGVGRVTKPGLDQSVGNAAINSTPRRMIAAECQAVCDETGYEGGLSVTICIPGGEELARRTFNPRLGIVGGISSLGTSGIVEPMSEQALADSLRLEMRQLYAAGRGDVLITIGNFAEAFARDTLGLSLESHITCSNFIGDAFAAAAELGFNRALLVGHIGKLVKLGIGITNTHSAHGDGRMETLIACALEAGAPVVLLRDIAGSVTTDAVLALLRETGLLSQTMAILGRRIQDTLSRHSGENMETGYICFGKMGAVEGVSDDVSREDEIVTQSANAPSLMEVFR